MGMKLIEFWAQGTRPMLQNRPTAEDLAGDTRSNAPGEKADPRDVAEKHVYRLKDRQLYFPSAGVQRATREAGGNHKAKGSRKTLKYLVPAAIVPIEDEMPIFLNDRKTKVFEYDVDSRPVTIPATKGRVMRHRARIEEWTVRCRLRINETLMSEDLVRTLVIEGLQQYGLGDNRPSFGLADLVHWQVISEPKKKTEAQSFAAGELPEAAE
jgi:hypothetical protein